MPYTVGQRVWVCYGAWDSYGWGRLSYLSVATVQRVIRMGSGRWRVTVGQLPGRAGTVDYYVDQDGADDGGSDGFRPTGFLSPSGHRWIAPHDDSLLGVAW